MNPFKTLILPNVAALSDEQCRQLREFVDRGGSIVATYETSLYDEWGARRKDFGLADLFGVTFRGSRRGPCRTPISGSRTTPRTHRRHPILAGLEDAPRIINGIYRLDVAREPRFGHPPLTLVPSYPDLPMEKVYPRSPKTDIPEVYLREIGAGRVVYFPWDIDRVFWELLGVDHGILLRNAVALGHPRRASGAGDGPRRARRDRLAAEGVDDRAPGQPHQPHDDEGPVPGADPRRPQEVVVQMPEGRKARKVQLLVADREVTANQEGVRLGSRCRRSSITRSWRSICDRGGGRFAFSR